MSVARPAEWLDTVPSTVQVEWSDFSVITTEWLRPTSAGVAPRGSSVPERTSERWIAVNVMRRLCSVSGTVCDSGRSRHPNGSPRDSTGAAARILGRLGEVLVDVPAGVVVGEQRGPVVARRAVSDQVASRRPAATNTKRPGPRPRTPSRGPGREKADQLVRLAVHDLAP